MLYTDAHALEEDLRPVLRWDESGVQITALDSLVTHKLDKLVHNAVFHTDSKVRETAFWFIWSAGTAFGAVSSSIDGLYQAFGQGKGRNHTVPAMNLRGLTYMTAQAAFRAARKMEAGAFIFEIARSEIGYTEQRPSEYAACILAAAMKTGFRGPVFLQGDHFQLNAKKYADNPDKELGAVRDLTAEAIRAGFFNIDIDSSTLVNLAQPTVRQQQEVNSRLTAELTEHVRSLEPKGVTVSVGGEIGEVGKRNSTVEELRAYMDQYLEILGKGRRGISKISVQSGTTHGGVPLPDGRIAEVKLDFGTLQELSRVAREAYGLSGAVQHGASTLPDEAFHRFPEVGTAEIHLATGFQNLLYEHEAFPEELRSSIYQYLKERHRDEWKKDQTEEQFLYQTRKKAFGPFKKQMWELPQSTLDRLSRSLEEKFSFLFRKLNVGQTRELTAEHVKLVKVSRPRPAC
ncbi:MAG: class II fructose-bisphosphate aldolase [bacterium]